METGDSSTASMPADLVAVVALALSVVAAWLLDAPDPIRHVLAVVAVFLPGYSLIALLFPAGQLRADESPGSLAERVEQLDAFGRVALSVAAGLVVTPLLGIALDFTPFSLRAVPTMATIAGFVVVTAAVAAVRRRRLSSDRRYDPAKRWRSVVAEIDPLSSQTLVTGVVVLAVLVAAGGVLVVVTVDQQGEQFSEFAVLHSENGQAVVANYPDAVTAGEEASVVLEIGNHEGSQQTYTVVPRLENVTRFDNRTAVLKHERFEAVTITVDENESVQFEHAVRPTMAGENHRLTFLLYRGDPPAQPRTGNAYRWTHIWVDVAPAD